MNGDFSRWTFDPAKGYTGVLEQQGRVRMDADFNEFVAILEHLRQSLTTDVIGVSGAPAVGGGFAVVTATVQTVDGQPRPKLEFSKGRIYVEGIACELASDTDLDAQPYPPAPVPGLDLPPDASDGSERIDLVYLDVWQRHVSAIEDEDLREVALQGPDTTTRLQTICQIRVQPDVSGSDASCAGPLPAAITTPSGGRLTTSVDVSAPPANPCIIAAGGGYTGLENRLYRVEIHRAGDLTTSNSATFKWSRDNAAIVYPIASFEAADRVQVGQLGRDAALALQRNDWVEVIGDESELPGEAGTLAQIDTIDEARRLITFKSGTDLTQHANEQHARLRRWDGAGSSGEGIAVSSADVEVEDGIKVRFGLDGTGTFHVGDYWFFAARTLGREVEILSAAPPHGIAHHFAKLALVRWQKSAGTWEPAPDGVCDCRYIFAPLTRGVSLEHAGGDGQEMMPPGTAGAGSWLCDPIRVRVCDGGAPIADATVAFRVVLPSPAGSALLEDTSSTTNTGATIKVRTDATGLAACRWRLDPSAVCQEAEALLEHCDGTPAAAAPIRFGARLSIAAQIANITTCPMLAGEPTVQAALDRVCGNSALYYVGGDGQEAPPGGELCAPLEVRLANGREPVAGAQIKFSVVAGAGILTEVDNTTNTGTTITVKTRADGLAACRWKLDDAVVCQRVVVDAGGPQLEVHFTARLQEKQAGDLGIRVLKLVLAGGGDFRNDDVLSLSVIPAGFQVECDAEIAPSSITRATCYVTVEDPNLVEGFYDFSGGGVFAAFVPLVLAAEVSVSRNEIFWKPTQPAVTVLDRMLQRLKQSDLPDHVLLRFTLKGNFIWSGKDSKVYLDGEVFGVVDPAGIVAPHGQVATRLDLSKGSGDGRRGGDFEMWFWLAGESFSPPPRSPRVRRSARPK